VPRADQLLGVARAYRQVEGTAPVGAGVGHEPNAALVVEQEVAPVPDGQEVDAVEIEVYDKHFV
jgi:hypothetical protein